MRQNFEFKHRYRPEVDQIKFSTWGDKRAPENYWAVIDNIAHFIGAGLDGLLRFGTGRSDWSTIRVNSTKEKFGDACVYCLFACDNLVVTAWEHDSNFMPGIEVPQEFIAKRQLQDARHYRETYKKAFTAWPQYYDAIRNGAQYPGLLCQSKLEFEELVASPFYAGLGFDLNEREIPISALYEVLGF